ncbi:hypothetical protein RB195_014296 [Necator americanus]
MRNEHVERMFAKLGEKSESIGLQLSLRTLFEADGSRNEHEEQLDLRAVQGEKREKGGSGSTWDHRGFSEEDQEYHDHLPNIKVFPALTYVSET